MACVKKVARRRDLHVASEGTNRKRRTKNLCQHAGVGIDGIGRDAVIARSSVEDVEELTSTVHDRKLWARPGRGTGGDLCERSRSGQCVKRNIFFKRVDRIHELVRRM